MPIIQFRFIFLSIALCTPLLAGAEKTIEQGEALYNQRSKGLETIQRSQEIFLNVLKDKQQSLINRQKAFDRFARLSVLVGELDKDSYQTNDPAKIFATCIDASEYLSPKNISQLVPEYVYWRSICLGLWAANASVTQLMWHIGRVKEFKELIHYGHEHFPTFDSYGFHRLLAGMKLRSKAYTMLNLYNPSKALSLIEVPLTHGTTIYLDYLLKAESLWALDRQQEAIEVLSFGIEELKQRIVDKALPDTISVESDYFLAVMIERLMSWN